jgi:hypothetical protein
VIDGYLTEINVTSPTRRGMLTAIVRLPSPDQVNGAHGGEARCAASGATWVTRHGSNEKDRVFVLGSATGH